MGRGGAPPFAPQRLRILAILHLDNYPRILACVAQITIYVPDPVARRLRREARRAKKSLSAYMTELAVGRPARPEWPDWFFELQGSCEGALEVPEDPPPEEPGEL
jgi:hypothetical protein